MSDTPEDDGTEGKADPPTPSEFIDWLRHWWDAPREKSKAADWALAGLTVLIALAAFWSAFMFQDQLNKTAEAFRLDERAWVEIEPIAATTISPPDEKFSAGFFCNIFPKNVGKTVATNIRVKAAASLRTGKFSPEEMQSFQRTLTAKDYIVNIAPRKQLKASATAFPPTPCRMYWLQTQLPMLRFVSPAKLPKIIQAAGTPIHL